MEILKGYLVHWPLADAVIGPEMIGSGRYLQKRSDSYRSTRWEEYELCSPIPLLPTEESNGRAEFRYKVICRRSGRRAIIASNHRKIIDAILEKFLFDVFYPRLRKVNILVHNLVDLLAFGKTQEIRGRRFLLTAIHARTTSYGPTLRSISLYGEDIGTSELFRREFRNVSCHSCGLGFSGGGGEIIRMSWDGALSFSLPDAERAQTLEETIGFVTDSGFINEGRLG